MQKNNERIVVCSEKETWTKLTHFVILTWSFDFNKRGHFEDNRAQRQYQV